MFSCEYCEIFKNTYMEEYLRTAAFEAEQPMFDPIKQIFKVFWAQFPWK